VAQFAQHKVAQYVTVVVRVVLMVAKNQRSIVKVINEILFHEKTNTAVDQLRTFREFLQLQLHRAVFLTQIYDSFYTMYNSCSDLLSGS
jgi:phage gp37-like protein